MVSCHVCGQEVISGWICGVIPAHDRYKLGLCPEHDTPENRAVVESEWDELLQGELAAAMTERRAQAESPVAHEVRILFLDGGIKIVRCQRFEITGDKDLLLLEGDGKAIFYPLQHIRSFETSEIDPRIDPASS
jgi:hypothetical protein